MGNSQSDGRTRTSIYNGYEEVVQATGQSLTNLPPGQSEHTGYVQVTGATGEIVSTTPPDTHPTNFGSDVLSGISKVLTLGQYDPTKPGGPDDTTSNPSSSGPPTDYFPYALVAAAAITFATIIHRNE